MRIAVFGLGYVGLTTAACLAKQGYQVCGVDIDPRKIDKVKSGTSPIQEPGIQELLAAGIKQNLLTAATVNDSVVQSSDVIMVCVGTPTMPDGGHNMDHVVRVTREIAASLNRGQVRPITLIFRSTFRPGTMQGLVMPILQSTLTADRMNAVEVVYNPEFLRESTAIKDYFHPPKIVIGTSDGQPSPMMERLCAGIEAQVFHTRFGEAEFIKLIDNTWHATKVAFANEMGRIAVKLGLDPQKIHELFVADTKLNISATYLRPGGPFGGSCLPKDVRAIQNLATDVGANSQLIDSIIHSNEAHKYFVFEHCMRQIKPGAAVLMIGIAFKNGSDDLRESPYVDLARRIMNAGYRLSIYDGYLNPDQLIGQNLGYSAIHLPDLKLLMVNREEAETGDYAVVIDTNGTSADLKTRSRNIVSLHAL